MGPSRDPSRDGYRWPSSNPLGVAVMVALVGLWELLVRSQAAELRFLPAPSQVLAAVPGAIADQGLVGQIAHTVGVTLAGWTVASLLGLALGLAMGVSPTVYRYSMTSVEAIRAIPPITFVPAAIVVFGFSFRMELVLVIFGGVWPVLINTIGGVKAIPLELHDVARTHRLNRWSRIRKIVLPAAAPSVVIGLRLALSLCLVLAIVAEMVGNPAGVGNGLISARQALRPPLMFVYVAVAGLLGVTLNAALRTATTKFMPPVPTGESRPW